MKKNFIEYIVKGLTRDWLVLFSAFVVFLYFIVALLAKLGWLASPWDQIVGSSYQPPSLSSVKLWLGTDIFGRSVFYKVIHGARVAMGVGLVSSIFCSAIGICLGSISGYFGGWIDSMVVWFYTTLSSIPNIMALIAITYLLGRGLSSVYIALSLTSWISLARVLRGEFIKHKCRDYVFAAQSLGAGHLSRIFKHILPNVSHFVVISFSTQFVSAIKSEVILSFLGLGVQGQPSWGVMIDDARLELARDVWWQLAGSTVAMFFVVLALNILGDAVRDVLDPRVG